MDEEAQRVYGWITELADCHLHPVGDGSALDVCGDLEEALYAAIELIPPDKLQAYWLNVKSSLMERQDMDEEDYQVAIEKRRQADKGSEL